MPQLNYKALTLGAVLGFMVAVVPSCGKAPVPCSPVNCDRGCCNAGVCVTSPANANNKTCGTAGLACSSHARGIGRLTARIGELGSRGPNDRQGRDRPTRDCEFN